MTTPTHQIEPSVQMIDFQQIPAALNTQLSELEKHVHQCMMSTAICRHVEDYQISPGTLMTVILKYNKCKQIAEVYVCVKPSNDDIENKVADVLRESCKSLEINGDIEKHLQGDRICDME